MAALMYQIANAKHPDVMDSCPDAPPCVGHIIDRLMEKNPDRRFQTGEELRQALDKCAKAVG